MDFMDRLQSQWGSDVVLHLFEFSSAESCQRFATDLSFLSLDGPNISYPKNMEVQAIRNPNGVVILQIGGQLTVSENYEIRAKAIEHAPQKLESIASGSTQMRNLDSAIEKLKSEGKFREKKAWWKFWSRDSEPSSPVSKETPTKPAASDSIRFECPHCGKRLRVAASAAGKRIRCLDCSKSVVVPGAAEVKKNSPAVIAYRALLRDDSNGKNPIDEDLRIECKILAGDYESDKKGTRLDVEARKQSAQEIKRKDKKGLLTIPDDVPSVVEG